jgi:hypothetical protein
MASGMVTIMRGAWRGMTAFAACTAIGATAVQADVIGGANVRVTFRGWLTPKALPRVEPAPVALHLAGSLKTSDGKPPPQLRRLTFAINRHGRVSTTGLPVCRRSALLATTSSQALAVCRDALIGRGSFKAHIVIPAQAPFPARGEMLAFNAREDGRQVILAHVFGTSPAPTSQVLTLTFQRQGRGIFGTTMSLRVPEFGDDWGHVTGFTLNLHRRYLHRGRKRSVISANCPAPTGFGSALFTAAKGTYHLGDGREITRVLTGTCKVKRP